MSTAGKYDGNNNIMRVDAVGELNALINSQTT
jgi:hypothetical protein